MTTTHKRKHQTPNDNSAAVDAWMLTSHHPQQDLISSLRELFLSLSGEVAEGIKWNAPSFRTHEYFATLHLRQKRGLGVILHLGAKLKDLPEQGVRIDDPLGLLTWLGKDRAMFVVTDAKDVALNRAALHAVLIQWLDYV